ncbi:MAG: hypothetical protein LBI16_00750, partial [Burkholderiales bacterium]|nr:hypothetical protein [Burkholderiales bacterium]
MLKEFPILCLGFLHGAIWSWFATYAGIYFTMGIHVRRIYLNPLRHFLIALTIVVAGWFAFIHALTLLSGKIEELYKISLGVAALLFFFVRLITILRAIDRHDKNWLRGVEQLETISYGNKRL